MSQLKQKEQIYPSLFYSDLNRLVGEKVSWGGPSTLLSLLLPMLIFSGNTLIDKTKMKASPDIRASLGPVKLTPAISHPKDVAVDVNYAMFLFLWGLMSFGVFNMLLITLTTLLIIYVKQKTEKTNL